MSTRSDGNMRFGTRQVSRRSLLKLVGIGVSAVAVAPLVAACAPPPSPTAAPAPPPKPAAVAPTTAPAPAPTQPAPTAAPKPAGAINVKYLTWLLAEKGRDENIRTVIKQYHDAQTKYQIEEVVFPFSEFDTKIFTQAAAGKIDGDAMNWQPSTGVRLMVAGHFAPMDPVIDKLGIRAKLEPGIANFFLRDGKYWALPTLGAPWGVMFNKELFQQAGLTRPAEAPEEYLEYARKLTKKPNQFGHACRTTLAERFGFFIDLSDWVVGLEGTWVDGKKIMVNSEKTLKAVNYYKQLYDEAIPQGATGSDYRRMNAEGKIAQVIEPAVFVATLKRANLEHYEKKLGGAAVPFKPKHRKLVGPTFAGVVDKSTQKDGAYDFWNFFHKPDIWSAMAQRAGDLFEPWKGAINQEYIKTLQWAPGFLAGEGVLLDSLYGDYILNANEIQQITLTHVSAVLTAGKKPEEALAAAQKELEEAAKGWQTVTK